MDVVRLAYPGCNRSKTIQTQWTPCSETWTTTAVWLDMPDIFPVPAQGDDAGIQMPWHLLPGATCRAFLFVSTHGLGKFNGLTTLLAIHHKA